PSLGNATLRDACRGLHTPIGGSVFESRTRCHTTSSASIAIRRWPIGLHQRLGLVDNRRSAGFHMRKGNRTSPAREIRRGWLRSGWCGGGHGRCAGCEARRKGDESFRLSEAADAARAARSLAVPPLTLPPRPAVARAHAGERASVRSGPHAPAPAPAGRITPSARRLTPTRGTGPPP